jgi:hypothetical protein
LFDAGRNLTSNAFIPLDLGEPGKSGALNARNSGWGAVDPQNQLLKWDSSKAAVKVFARSCNNFVALGLEIRIDPGPGRTPPVPSYGTFNQAGSPYPCEPGSGCAVTNSAFFGGIEPGFVWVEAYELAHDGGAQKLVAREHVFTEADSLTLLDWFFPSTSL